MAYSQRSRLLLLVAIYSRDAVRCASRPRLLVGHLRLLVGPTAFSGFRALRNNASISIARYPESQTNKLTAASTTTSQVDGYNCLGRRCRLRRVPPRPKT
ncbi:hypothetical protein BZA05DRAFT_391922 [Tricharina praecox]|uniref:uncharacterized protein n=1 Tax=Tricharina praecox TaxID=43433 RepID=UPI00221E5186|nr:uncharacterized protein BZA05DRAFT_391922 [Tricharina praecox]KAI5854564.1 hypothetical protein BZA05DRAFT_391922 [Tricharina praecox]